MENQKLCRLCRASIKSINEAGQALGFDTIRGWVPASLHVFNTEPSGQRHASDPRHTSRLSYLTSTIADESHSMSAGTDALFTLPAPRKLFLLNALPTRIRFSIPPRGVHDRHGGHFARPKDFHKNHAVVSPLLSSDQGVGVSPVVCQDNR